MTKESLNGQRPSTLHVYLCMYVFIVLIDTKAGVFKDFQVVLLQSKI